MTAQKPKGQDYGPSTATITTRASSAIAEPTARRGCVTVLSHGLPELAQPGWTPKRATPEQRAAALLVAEALGLIPTVQKPPEPKPPVVRKLPPRKPKPT